MVLHCGLGAEEPLFAKVLKLTVQCKGAKVAQVKNIDSGYS